MLQCIFFRLDLGQAERFMLALCAREFGTSPMLLLTNFITVSFILECLHVSNFLKSDWRCEIKVKLFTFGFGATFCLKLGEDQKKKVFALVGIEFCDRIHFKSRVKTGILLLPMTMGGLFLILEQNWSQKN